jgi:hypothetical protein
MRNRDRIPRVLKSVHMEQDFIDGVRADSFCGLG